MARRGRNTTVSTETVEPVDVDVDETDETEEVAAPTEVPAAKETKPKKEPVRGELHADMVTPVGLAKVISERKLHKNRDGEIVDVAPQMVYSYIKNAPKDDPFPFVEGYVDQASKPRQAAKVEDAVAWWVRKTERAASRKTNAAEKAAKPAKATDALETPVEDVTIAEEAE
jgi:hypothetical protein